MPTAFATEGLTKAALEELIRSDEPIPMELRAAVQSHPDFLEVAGRVQQEYADACRADKPFEEVYEVVSLDELIEQGFEI